jgi:murein DD-endopeptidase MepM/ murein hydrolase activator NlpD
VIRITHPNGFTNVYAHNLRNVVKVGDPVGPETVIGAVGRSGLATGYHLHFEIRRGERAVNPLALLDGREPGRVMLAKGPHVR